MKRALTGLLALLLVPLAGADGRVFDENTDDLPPGCVEVAGDEAITVHAGREYAEEHPGRVFTFDQRDFDFPPCTRVTVTFVNEDPIRHEFMVHGAHPNGTFLLEATGPTEVTGTFILGGQVDTLLFHCGIPTHQQMGMKGQFRVGGGDGDLPNIIGISGIPDGDAEGSPASWWPLLAALLGLAWLRRRV